MKKHLNLIKTGHQSIEKRVFPRFPFSYLVFKRDDNSVNYQVKDISYGGMSLALKDGVVSAKLDDEFSGEIHWYDQKVNVKCIVRRVEEDNIGVEFVKSDIFDKSLLNFLSVSNVSKNLRPIHEYDEQMDLPIGLKTWLRCDGPFEIFVWHHRDGEISKIQILMMDSILEWTDGEGIQTGKVLSVRPSDKPLTHEEEIEFLIDSPIDQDKLEFANELVQHIPESLISEGDLKFLTRKISG
ncbi:PilZ domain-containing protein [Halobacteriovorax sp. YZS-1-1]|uniref:PilZ domain-containing protein n=1 Tax=unclassified Halobacteriovorax TaxID=2639665 RepID=UPI00399B1D75